MRRLSWTETDSTVTWNQVGRRWLGGWARGREREGVFASARSSMISVVHDGVMNVDFCGRNVELRAGDALLIRGAAPFRYTMSSGTRIFVTEVAESSASVELARVPASRLPRAAAVAFARAREESPSDLLAVAHAADLLFKHSGEVLAPRPPHSSALMLRIKAHLDDHFREPGLRIHQTAKLFGVDAFYLARQFERVVGMTPKAYLQWLRFEHFLRTLLCEPRPMIELALEAGFSDYATFSRRVRAQLGCPPSELMAG